MLKKLMNGEFSLKETFWKFGVAGLSGLVFLVYVLGKMLSKSLHGSSVLAYFLGSSYGNNSWTIVLIVLHLSSTAFLFFYAISLVLGIWRSSAEYDRSLWFRHLSRIFVLLMVFLAVRFVLKSSFLV